MAMRLRRSATSVTGAPSMAMMMSPWSRPLFFAGESSVTSEMRAPPLALPPKLLARLSSTSWMTTPSQPRVTLPLVRNCFSMFLAMLMGMAKPMPM